MLHILSEVRKNGDHALRNYTKQFDQVNLENLRVSAEEFAEASQLVSEQFITAMQAAKKNILRFHQEQKRTFLVHQSCRRYHAWPESDTSGACWYLHSWW
ncbi:histidinol dehydrogenase [Virgibacillus halophilus]|uniref:Histidinol dehydrogenase n=1 Tax=Tigheibacillus halophilus TaxID=361280 RepID=A0ABU5C8S8_9BACI|nr:histidinol dehydrogenase [Virgibacillus halophilus]